MPFAAITYRVKTGHEEEIAEMFAQFQRVDTPVMGGDGEDEAGRLLGTAVFIKDEVMVRIIHFEGDFSAVAKHMAKQRGVHIIEEKLAPYLAEPRDTSTPEAFGAYFRDSVMRSISQLSVDTHPVNG